MTLKKFWHDTYEQSTGDIITGDMLADKNKPQIRILIIHEWTEYLVRYEAGYEPIFIWFQSFPTILRDTNNQGIISIQRL